MLLYKNHRFHCEGVSFAIPDGYGLDTSYEEVPEDTLHLWSEDKYLYIRVGIERETKGPFEELAFVLQELDECIIDQAPTALLLNGLSGYGAIYSVGNRQYMEYHLWIAGDNSNQTELLLLFISRGKLPAMAELQELVQSIGPRRESI